MSQGVHARLCFVQSERSVSIGEFGGTKASSAAVQPQWGFVFETTKPAEMNVPGAMFSPTLVVVRWDFPVGHDVSEELRSLPLLSPNFALK